MSEHAKGCWAEAGDGPVDHESCDCGVTLAARDAQIAVLRSALFEAIGDHTSICPCPPCCVYEDTAQASAAFVEKVRAEERAKALAEFTDCVATNPVLPSFYRDVLLRRLSALGPKPDGGGA